MPFREKTAWISLVTMLAVFGAFYGAVGAGAIVGVATVHFLILSVLAVIVLQVAATVVAAGLSRDDDPRSPRDERERLIELKATRIAFYVMIITVFAAMFVLIHTPLMGFHVGAPQLALWVTGGVILGDVVKNAAQIIYFRRGV
jgi:hypothetical protein